VSSYDYVTVGHVTIDVLADGTRRPGGTALYSALQAARLGLRTLILTRGVPAEIEGLLEPYRDELDLRVLPAEHTTTLQTVGEGLARHQRLLAWAGPIEGPIEVDTTILHLAPVARETPREFRDAGLPRTDAAHLPHADAAHPPHADVAHPPAHPPHAHDGPPLQAEFVGLTPQGLVREWDAAGEIALVPLRPEQLPERCDAWVLSERERECCAEPAARATAGGTVVAVTAGEHPTELQLPGGQRLRVPVPPIAAPVEDLGAGDVFAAAFFIALHEGLPPAQAAAFANAAASVRVAGAGHDAIGDRRAITAQRRGNPVRLSGPSFCEWRNRTR
jgi:sugar/nucleoside kinase (ribokinase family)